MQNCLGDKPLSTSVREFLDRGLHSTWTGVGSWMKRRKGVELPTSPLLVPIFGYNVTSYITLLPSRPPCHGGLHSQSVNHNKRFLLWHGSGQVFGHSQGIYATPQGNVGLWGRVKPVLWLESKQVISAQEFPFLPRLTNTSCFLLLLFFVCCVCACIHTRVC